MFSIDPPDDDGPDPDRCDCGAYLEHVGLEEPEQVCPVCDLPSDLADLRAVREQLEAEVPESGVVPF
jgi:hypothetical protein